MLRTFSAPLSVFLNITNGCNLRCTYCSAESGVPAADELTTREWSGLIDELGELKVFNAVVTGGEPFVHRDSFFLLERLLMRGVAVSLNTNGTLITTDRARQLDRLGIRDVSVSLDGTTARVNDRTRGSGSFERALRGVEILLERNIYPHILVTVTRFNYRHVIQIAAALRGLNVASVSFNPVTRLGRGICNWSMFELGQSELEELARQLSTARSSLGSFVGEDLLHWFQLPQRLERARSNAGHGRATLLPCGAAKTSCAITADGWVLPCNNFVTYRCGNVRSESLKAIWCSERMSRIRRLEHIPTATGPGCQGCRYNGYCFGGCRALAYLEFGDLIAPDPMCSVLADSGLHGYTPVLHERGNSGSSFRGIDDPGGGLE